MSKLRILVPVKRVIDYAVKPRVNKAQTAVETSGVKHSMNPFDELSIEEAVRLRERKHDVEDIVAFSAGPAKSQDVLRTAMAMGADRGIHVVEEKQELEPLGVAKLLRKVVEEEKSNMVILGKQSIDDDANQTGQMLAGLLGWSQATQASKLEIEGETCTVTREVDGGVETLRAKLPIVVTTDLRLNEPRYASLPNIMKAKKKPLVKKTLGDYGVDAGKRLKTVKVEEPKAREGGGKVEDVGGLISRLKELGALSIQVGEPDSTRTLYTDSSYSHTFDVSLENAGEDFQHAISMGTADADITAQPWMEGVQVGELVLMKKTLRSGEESADELPSKDQQHADGSGTAAGDFSRSNDTGEPPDGPRIPQLYEVVRITHDEGGKLADLRLLPLLHCLKPTASHFNSYRIFGPKIMIPTKDTAFHSSRKGWFLSINDVGTQLDSHYPVSLLGLVGDDLRYNIFDRVYPAHYDEGVLHCQHKLEELLDPAMMNDLLATSDPNDYGEMRVPRYRPLCPVCMGWGFMLRYANMIQNPRHYDVEDIRYFYRDLNDRFDELGYTTYSIFHDDDDEDEDDYDDDDDVDRDGFMTDDSWGSLFHGMYDMDDEDEDVWQEWDEAEISTSELNFRPAQDAAVQTLLRNQKAASGTGESCAICKDDFEVGEMVLELPCGHTYCGSESGCIITWLRTMDSCPQCRARLPEADADRKGARARAGKDEEAVVEDEGVEKAGVEAVIVQEGRVEEAGVGGGGVEAVSVGEVRVEEVGAEDAGNGGDR